MLKKLPKGFRILVLFLLSLSILFIIFSLTVTIFSFPFSTEQVSSFLARKVGRESSLTDSQDSPFGSLDRPEYGDIVEFDPDSVSDTSVDMFENRVTLESLIPGYEVSFTQGGLVEYNTYIYGKGFWEPEMIARVYKSDEIAEIIEEQGDSFTPEFITAERLTIQLLPYSENAQVYSGSEIDMSLGYTTSGSNITIQIGVKEEDLNTNIEKVENTLEALIYQGVHIATYAKNSDGRTPDEYPFTPDIFYTALRDAFPRVELRRTTSSAIFKVLESLGIIRRAHAYCWERKICACGSIGETNCDPDCYYSSTHDRCVREINDCYWSSYFGVCTSGAPLCGYLSGSTECFWVNPEPDPGCAEDGEQCDSSADCCEGLHCVMGSISGICQPMDDTPEECTCSCQWFCGDIRSSCGDCCDNVALSTPDEHKDWCSEPLISACLPPEGCGGDSSGDISNWVVGRVFERRADGGQTIYVRGRDCNNCGSDWQRFNGNFRIHVIQDDGTPHESSWGCNDCPYHHNTKKSSMSGNWWNFVITPPPDVYCDEWRLTYTDHVLGNPLEHNDGICVAYFDNGSCKTIQGEGCEAYVLVPDADDWSNHLNFFVTRCVHSGLNCGNLRATNAGDTTPISCVLDADGMVIDVYMDSSNAEYVWFPTWTEVGGQDDLVWYSATHQGGGLWKATIDLKNHPGMGTVHIHGYAENCAVDGRQHYGSITLEKVTNPQVADLLYETVTCSATQKTVDFRWYYDSSIGYIPPASIIRVDKIDDPNFYNCGCPFSWGCNWMTENDVFSWVDTGSNCYYPWSWSTWHQCNWGGYAGAAKCGVKSGCDCTYSSYQAGLLEGEYEWDVQSIDACTQDYRNPHDFKTAKESFICFNEPPECGDIVGPDTVLFGDTVTFSSWVMDSMDPVTYEWKSEMPYGPYTYSCNGTFNPSSGSVVSPTPYDVSTQFTAPLSRDSCSTINYNIGSDDDVPIILEVDDSEKQTVCQKEIKRRFPLITGTIYDATAGTCGDKSNPLPYFSSNPDLTVMGTVAYSTRYGHYAIDPATGFYESSIHSGPFSVGSTLESLYLEESTDLDLPADSNLQIACVEEDPFGGGLQPTLSSLTAFGSYTVPRAYPGEGYPDPITIDLGYQLVSALEGWFTVLDGSVYSGGNVTMVTPQVSLAYGNDMTDDYAFSAGDLRINTRVGDETISSEGYAYNFSPSFFDIAVTEADFSTEADGLQRINTSFPSSLSPNQIYIMSASLFEDFMDNYNNYSSRIFGSGIVVIYIEGELTFEHNFYSTDPNKKILLITENKVTFSEELGVDIPNGNGTDSSRIDVSIFTSGSIDFPGVTVDTTLDIIEPGDSTLVINGTLIAGGNINFNRDRTINDAGELRNMYPGVAIHYDPALGHYLQQQLMDDVNDFEKLFLNLISVSWDLEEGN